jgi:hypothetical protein
MLPMIRNLKLHLVPDFTFNGAAQFFYLNAARLQRGTVDSPSTPLC